MNIVVIVDDDGSMHLGESERSRLLPGSTEEQIKGLQKLMWGGSKEAFSLRTRKKNESVRTKDAVVFRFTAELSAGGGACIRILEDFPYACLGSCRLRSWTVQVEDESTPDVTLGKRTNERSQDESISFSAKEMDKKMDLLWEVVLGSVADRIAIDSLPHDLVASKLYDKLTSGMFEHINAIELWVPTMLCPIRGLMSYAANSFETIREPSKLSFGRTCLVILMKN